MLTLPALTILIIVLGAIILFSVFKNVIKAALSLSFLVLIIIVVIGFLFVSDARDFKTVFTNNYSTYILEDNNSLTASFEMISLNISSFKPVDIDVASQRFLDEGPGKIIVINKEVLNTSVDDELNDLIGLDFETAINSNDNKIKSSAFLIALVTTLKDQKKTYMLKQLRTSNVAILPKTMVVKVLTFDTNKYINKIKQIIENNKDSVSNLVTKSANLINKNISIVNISN